MSSSKARHGRYRWAAAALAVALVPSLAGARGEPAADGGAPPPSSSGESEASGERITLKEALEWAFPKCQVVRGTIFLDKKTARAVEKVAGSRLVTRVLHPYRATRRDPKTGQAVLVGTAWFETHRVRSKRETLMVVVDPKGRIARIEVLAFAEPRDYLPRRPFYGQFEGKVLDENLRIGKDLRMVAGCTLTCRATADAARRILALHRVVEVPPEPELPQPKPAPEKKRVP